MNGRSLIKLFYDLCTFVFSFFNYYLTKNTFKYKNYFSLIGLIVKWKKSKKKKMTKLYNIEKIFFLRFYNDQVKAWGFRIHSKVFS